MATRKHTDKIWVYNNKVYRSEAEFMKKCHESSRYEVSIYQKVETHQAGNYLTHLKVSRERDDQLSVLLDDDRGQEIANVNHFRELLIKYKPTTKENRVWNTQSILNSLQNDGVSYQTFKKIASNFREWLLYDISNEEEWYEALLRCHNFTGLLPSRTKSRWVYGTGSVKTEIPTPPEALSNFEKAKLKIKQEKKKLAVS